jgi:hypothetical protein
MERKFKVGDGVNNVDYGDGKVIDVFPHQCNFPYTVAFESGMRDCFDDDGITLIDRPQTTEPPKYDRAMIAAMCLQVLCSMQNKGVIESIQDGIDSTAKMSVMYADALIAELEKPKQ